MYVNLYIILALLSVSKFIRNATLHKALSQENIQRLNVIEKVKTILGKKEKKQQKFKTVKLQQKCTYCFIFQITEHDNS